MAKLSMLSKTLAYLKGELSVPSSDTSKSSSKVPADNETKQPVPTTDNSKADTDSTMQTVIGGDATAIGENTYASGSVYSRTTDKGAIKISSGSADFRAAAHSSDSDSTYAAANSYASASGADLFLTRTTVSSDGGKASGQSYSGETSRTVYRAIDIEKVDLPKGPILINQTVEKNVPHEPGLTDGNLAAINVDSTAAAEYTYVAVDASALTMEDSLSTISATVVTEVG